MKEPIVSVACITYNHEKFIRQAIESFLMQETDFPVEIIIHDDASTDATPAIMREYAARYPERIAPIFQTENQYSQGRSPTVNFLLPRCRGKYIALCEGDDYWTDPHKLQKQVDFLEKHPECALSAHNTKISYQKNSLPDRTFLPQVLENDMQAGQEKIFGIQDLFKYMIFHTSSCLFRNGAIKSFPDYILKLPALDFGLFVLLAQSGQIGYINEVMSVYRNHGSGVWTGLSRLQENSSMLREFQILYGGMDPIFRPYIVEAMYQSLFGTAEFFLDEKYSKDVSISTLKNGAGEIFNSIFNDLSFEQLHIAQLRRKFYSRFYASLGFRFYKDNKVTTALNILLRAVYYDISWVNDRGLWSIVFESIIGRKSINYLRQMIHSVKPD